MINIAHGIDPTPREQRSARRSNQIVHDMEGQVESKGSDKKEFVNTAQVEVEHRNVMEEEKAVEMTDMNGRDSDGEEGGITSYPMKVDINPDDGENGINFDYATGKGEQKDKADVEVVAGVSRNELVEGLGTKQDDETVLP